ncbi:hypothetical protein GEMRC1_005436 [Eukaryota sp. GEM-RC1]
MSFFSTDYSSDFFDSSFDFDTPVIAHKIKDGLYIGGAEAAYRSEFIFSNKITFIINCAAGQVDERWSSQGVKYLSFPWRDDSSCVIIDPERRNLRKVSQFVKTARSMEQCVLIHSLHGRSRCVALVAAYLMDSYQWDLKTTRDFLSFKLSLKFVKPGLWKQLEHFSKFLKTSSPRPVSPDSFDEREVLLNTHQNTSLGGLLQPKEGPYLPQFRPTRRIKRRAPAVRFGDVYLQPMSTPSKTETTPILKVKSPSVAPYGLDEEEWKLKQEQLIKELNNLEVEKEASEIDITDILENSPDPTPTPITRSKSSKSPNKDKNIMKLVLEKPGHDSSSDEDLSDSLSSKFFALPPSPRTNNKINAVPEDQKSPLKSPTYSSLSRSQELSRRTQLGSSIQSQSTFTSKVNTATPTSMDQPTSKPPAKVKKIRKKSTVSPSLLASTVASL